MIVGLGLQHRRDERGAEHAVDDAVVHLAGEREAPALQAVDQVDLPEGAASIEGPGEQIAHQGLELRLGARAGQNHVPHVRGELEAVVVDPHRMVDERDALDPLAVAGQRRQPAGDERT